MLVLVITAVVFCHRGRELDLGGGASVVAMVTTEFWDSGGGGKKVA